MSDNDDIVYVEVYLPCMQRKHGTKIINFTEKEDEVMGIGAANENASQIAGLRSSAKADTAAKADEKSKKEEAVEREDDDTAAVYEKGDEKNSIYDTATVDAMLKESNLKTENFRKLIEKVLNNQTEKFYMAHPKEELTEEGLSGKLKDFFTDLEVDPETAAQAQKDISEDGYYGVKQTADRILKFAKAMAGNDPEKLETMYEAVHKGFKDAEKIWGGSLPEISSKTLEAIEQGFDDWRKEIAGGT